MSKIEGTEARVRENETREGRVEGTALAGCPLPEGMCVCGGGGQNLDPLFPLSRMMASVNSA